jgi:hypothetical protein
MKKQVTIFFSCLLFSCTLLAQPTSWGKYTLICPGGGGPGGGTGGNTGTLYDLTNTAYHTWAFNSNTGYSTHMVAGGTLYRSKKVTPTSLNGGGSTGGFQKVDWAGNVLWDYNYNTTNYLMHHDICPMPNGNLLAIAWEVKSVAQVDSAGSNVSHIMWPDKIVEFQQTGPTTASIVWEWHAFDHIMQNVNPQKANYQAVLVDHPELLDINYKNTSNNSDWLHMNGLDYNAETDLIAVSMHNMNELYVIDHSTTTSQAASHAGGNHGKGGDILYRWGNPAAYGGTGTANFSTIHDARFIPEGGVWANNMTAYNNNGVSQTVSAVDMILPPYDAQGDLVLTPGQTQLPATYLKRVLCNGHNNNMGSGQTLPNGNMLTCIALSAKVQELDSNGVILYTYQGSGSIAQAHRYSECFVAGTLAATPTITQLGNTLTSSAATSYQWMMNGVPIAGATSQTYTVAALATYRVQVKDAANCESALSNKIKITALEPNAIGEVNAIKYFNVYPNPSEGVVYLYKLENELQNWNAYIINNLGQVVYTGKNSSMINMSNFTSGRYTLKIESNNKTIYTQSVNIIK